MNVTFENDRDLCMEHERYSMRAYKVNFDLWRFKITKKAELLKNGDLITVDYGEVKNKKQARLKFEEAIDPHKYDIEHSKQKSEGNQPAQTTLFGGRYD